MSALAICLFCSRSAGKQKMSIHCKIKNSVIALRICSRELRLLLVTQHHPSTATGREPPGTNVANRLQNKLTKVVDNIYCCRSGLTTDTQAIAVIVAYSLYYHEYGFLFKIVSRKNNWIVCFFQESHWRATSGVGCCQRIPLILLQISGLADDRLSSSPDSQKARLCSPGKNANRSWSIIFWRRCLQWLTTVVSKYCPAFRSVEKLFHDGGGTESAEEQI